jgi:hypothetical protein
MPTKNPPSGNDATDQRPVIRIAPGQLHVVVAEAVKALHAARPLLVKKGLYANRGGLLEVVWPSQGHGPCADEYFRLVLCEAIRWEKQSRGKWEPADPPKDVVWNLKICAPEWAPPEPQGIS